MQQTTRLLLSCGATIQEINCVRKHLSSVKGGRLAQMMAPATSVNLILSDVVGDDPASIASGITAPDSGTYGEAAEILRRYGVFAELPEAVQVLITDGQQGRVPETPTAGDEVFSTVHNVVIGSNAQALQAAAQAAESAGYNTVLLGSRIIGEAREIGKIFPGMARELRDARQAPGTRDARKTGTRKIVASVPACVLAGGETTVTIHDENGKGGRNQELVLSALREAVYEADQYDHVVFASVASDGNDGPTDAAGAYIDAEVIRRAARDKSAVERALAHNDSYTCLDALSALIRTGPTNTNVCDFQILLVDRGRVR
jgi:glycerate-2-kinase